MASKPQSIDDYLARIPADRRAALQHLRLTIRAILPDAVECISYSMPAFRYERRVVAGFLATAAGCSYYPFSGTTLATLASQLSAYGQTKSALHFAPDTPLPKALVRRLLMARLAENGHLASASPSRARSAPKASKRATASERGATSKRGATKGPSTRTASASRARSSKRTAAKKRRRSA